MRSNNVDRIETKEKDIVLNDEHGFPYIYIGRGSYCSDHIGNSLYEDPKKVHLIYIGRYTAIARNLKIYCDFNHAYKALYVGVIPDFENEYLTDVRQHFGQSTWNLARKGMTVIGSDVWIGDDVTIISDVLVGNGAVIAARSVVTKDIPPYTIWAGNPARQIGTHFPKETCEDLLKISWWEFDGETLKGIEEDMKGAAETFAIKYRDRFRKRYEDFVIRKASMSDGKPTMAAFVDLETQYSTFCEVVDAFCDKFADRKARLKIYYHTDDHCEKAAAEAVTSVINEVSAMADVELVGISVDEDEAAICTADYFILGRDLKNISRIGYAMKYGVEILSGVDIPMFTKDCY